MAPTDSLQALLLAANEVTVSFDLAHMWRAMGPFARFVTGVLAVMSVYSLAVMVERLVTFRRALRSSRRFATELRQLLPAGRLADAATLAGTLQHGHLCRVLGLAIEEYQRGLAAVGSRGSGGQGAFDVIDAVNRSVERSSVRVASDLRRGLGGLATVGSTAPFVGLLGTVAGIITAFQAMAATGSGGLGSVSNGIAEALVTTALGLLVAIPAVMMFNYLTYRVEAMEVDIADAAGELVDFLIKDGRHTAGRAE
jgi:biopolymer transport protein ExbB